MLAKSSTELVRQQNSALVLSALRRHRQMAHTHIAEATGLASATVSAITSELEAGGIIEKSEQLTSSGRGRPRVLFSPRRECGYLIIIIISSDSIQYSLVDYAGTLLDRFNEVREAGGVAGFVASLNNAVDRIIARSGISQDRVLLVSISSKGLVHRIEAVLIWSPVFGAEAIDFNIALSRRWSAKVVLNNETLLVASALLDQGARRDGVGEQMIGALSLGHSIGLGTGRSNADGTRLVSAPNFGHMLHVPNGGLCRCGSRGCIEAYAGFYAILRTAFEVPEDTVPAKFVPMSEIDKIAAQARQGKRNAKHAFRQAGIALGTGLSRLLSLHGHMPFVITGPGIRYYDLLEAGLRDALAESHSVRLGGLPDIRVEADEATLLFNGHLTHSFAILDQDISSLRHRGKSLGAR
jgi:predicted NBD/HSP70 family sugar kinase/predicted transcriptional regulator